MAWAVQAPFVSLATAATGKFDRVGQTFETVLEEGLDFVLQRTARLAENAFEDAPLQPASSAAFVAVTAKADPSVAMVAPVPALMVALEHALRLVEQ